jgi:hypothetical protein
MNLYYKTNSDVMAEIKQKMNFKDNTPGPMTYDVAKSCFKTKKVPVNY